MKKATMSVLLMVLLSACAGTRTQQSPISSAMVEAEQERQRGLVLQTLTGQQARLDEIAFPLLVSSVEICGNDVTTKIGVRWTNNSYYEDDWQVAATNALGLTDTLEVLSVWSGSPASKAGLSPGDRILTLDGAPVPSGKESLEFVGGIFDGRATSVVIGTAGSDGLRTIQVQPVRLCSYNVNTGNSSDINAYADGEQVVVTSGMMRFADDAELAVVVGHEIAHNAMGHISAMKSNSLWGGILGAVVDGLAAAGGVETGGAYTQLGVNTAAAKFSQDFEREADYVGLYILARAGVEIDQAPDFWRHMAIANPGSIGLATSHPTSAERFVRIEQAVNEIEEKIQDGRPLLPEMKPGNE